MSITMLDIDGEKKRIRFFVFKDKKKYRIKKKERGIIINWLQECIKKYGIKNEPQMVQRSSGFSILFSSDTSR